MAIYTGLIHKLKASDDEIAQVMGHEIAHALLNHTAERMSVAMATQLGIGIYASRKDADPGKTALAAVAAQLAITLPNSRTSESEADRIGIELAAKAGYDPRAAVSLWQKMAIRSASGGQPVAEDGKGRRRSAAGVSQYSPVPEEPGTGVEKAGEEDDALLSGREAAPAGQIERFRRERDRTYQSSFSPSTSIMS